MHGSITEEMVRHVNDSLRNGAKDVTLTARGVLHGGRRLFPIAVFTIPFGIAFGVAAIENGLTGIEAILMSVITFSGVAQFAAPDFLQVPLALGSLAMVLLALNARHVVMGAALSPWLNRLPLGRRILALSYMSDPNFAESQPAFQGGERDVGILLGGGLILWACWVVGTAIGALGGEFVGDPASFGIDVVMPCFFAAVVAGQLGQAKVLLPSLIAGVIAASLLDVVPAGWNVVIAALAVGVVGALFHAE